MAESGLGLDPFQSITNVKWGGGLPVEFDNSGHVLWQGAPINMKKGTISMWFRVPEQSLPDYKPGGSLSPLLNMIPILAFSKQPYGPWTEMTFPVINTFYKATNSLPPYDFQPFPYYGAIPGPTWQLPYWPCVIAVYIPEDGNPRLAVVLQTTDIGVASNTNQALIAADGSVGTGEGMLFGPTKNYWASADVVDVKMEWFDPNFTGPEIKLNTWHHILLSWDLQDQNSAHGNAYDPNVGPGNKPFHEYFTAKSILYCALDDKNLTGNNLPTSYWTDGFGDNEIACYSCWALAGKTYFTVPPNPDLSPPYAGFPQYTVAFANGIVMDTVAVPSEPAYERWLGDPANSATEAVDPLKKIEVAELQIFSDLLLDTSDSGKRRAFIDFVKEEGGEMGPVNPKEAEKILGQRPDILLHTTKNWQSGKNTGKIGLERVPDADDEIIEAGQFKPTETIRKYTPDPRLTPQE